MMRGVKVKGFEGLIRDPQTTAILNTNKEERELYLKRRNRQRENEERLNKLEKDVSALNEKLDLILKYVQK